MSWAAPGMRTPACSGDSPASDLGALRPPVRDSPPRDCASGARSCPLKLMFVLSTETLFVAAPEPAWQPSWPAVPAQRNDGTNSRRVLRAVPVQEISIEDGSINVEMDPEDQFQAVQSLERMSMQ